MKLDDLRSRAKQWWRQEIRPILILLTILVSVRSSIADWNDVPTGSMKPTILEGDRIFINKLAYDLKIPFTTWHVAEWSNPKRGDVVVFFSPHDETRLVKRVVGLPGDTIELRNEQLIINGEPITYSPLESAKASQMPESERRAGNFAVEQLPGCSHSVMAIPQIQNAVRSFEPIRIPDGQYFMMGDNRDNSFDSRYFGTVERRRIIGQATRIVMSIDKAHHWLPRAQRFLKAVDPEENDGR